MKPHQFEAKVPAEPKDDLQVMVKPNPLTLVVQISKSDLALQLNNDKAGNVTDTQPLVDRLTNIFKQREANGVFREGTNEVEKTVFVKAPKGVKYGDVVKVIDGIKISGAQPIGLQVDDLAE